jgi:hypothetical protein
VLRILSVNARLDGMPSKRMSFCVSGSFSPDATVNCHATRSRPVTASVTGCSTWSRVFISMNQKPSGRSACAVGDELDGAGADIADRLAASTAAGADRRAQLRGHAGRGRFLDHLLVARCSEQSRSPRWMTLPCVSARPESRRGAGRRRTSRSARGRRRRRQHFADRALERIVEVGVLSTRRNALAAAARTALISTG